MTKVRQAVIMVGGMGTRLLPLTKNRPKPILPVLDKPCLRYLIESLVSSGVEEIILACGYKSTQLVDAIGDGSDMGITISYSYEDEPLGTAGAIKKVESRLDDVFVAANGDVFADLSMEEQIDMHFSCNADVTLALTPVDDTIEFGTARLDDDHRIIEFKEKVKREDAPSNLANAGIYIINKQVLSYVPDNTFYDFSRDLLPILMTTGQKRIQGFMLKGIWRDVGRPKDLLGVNLQMASKRYDQMSWGGSQIESTNIMKPFYIGKGASISGSEASAAVIMENTVVKGSKILNTMIMKDCRVDASRIENSIIGVGCKVGPGAEIISSIVGDGAVIEANRKITDEKVY